MPDLHAINLHLQERLERDWRDDVRAPEAARWLDKAGLLPDRKGALPLRNLLRDGRIAGQEQRPDKRNGTWFIRRLAASRDPDEIRAARERIRRCLPVDRDAIPADWPVPQGPDGFWQELGRTIAAFGHLEQMLGSACYALLIAPEQMEAFLESPTGKAASRWVERTRKTWVDALHGLISEFDRGLRDARRIPHAVREGLVADLRLLRPWRNALCHGAWLDVDEDGCGHLVHFFLDDGALAAFEPRKITLQGLSDVRARTLDVTIRVVEAASVSGPLLTPSGVANYALGADLPRMHEWTSADSDS